MRRERAIYSALIIARESTTVTCILAETQKQTEEWESLITEKERLPDCALLGGCWTGEVVGRPLDVDILCRWLEEHIWLSLAGPKLQTGQKLGKLSIINQVLAIWGQLIQGALFGALDL